MPQASIIDAAYGAAAVWAEAQRALAPRAAALMAARLAADEVPDWPTHLPEPVAGMLAGHAALLAAWIHARHRGAPLAAGLAGGQGSGKSTLAALTARLLEREFGLRSAVVSLDDLYLSRAARAELAQSRHPLFVTRGVPGTHDVARGIELLDALLGSAGERALPRFDKGRDEPQPEAAWPRLTTPVDVVLFEGWCVGAEPESDAALAEPVNDLEREEDAEGHWRRAVNAALAGPYAELFRRLDALVFLAVPDFTAARRWREEQEAVLRQRTEGAMSPADVQRFVAHYERLTRAMLTSMPARVDLCLRLDPEHRIAAVGPGGAWRARGFRRDSARSRQHPESEGPS